MPIDWFTVVAQLINFLILVWLLKRFLYRPILEAIDEREKRIATQLTEAEAKKAEAREEYADFQHKNEAIDQERAALLNKARDEAKAERERLLDEARADADSLRAKRHEALQGEQRDLSQQITRWTQKQVFAISRKTLADLATASLEERMSDVFVQRLRALTGEPKEQMAAALYNSAHAAIVRTAFDLAAEQRSAIERTIKDTFAVETQVRFETAPDLVSGIELTASGRKVAWSIAEYLATLEKSAGELLNGDGKSEPNHQPAHGPEPVPRAPEAGH